MVTDTAQSCVTCHAGYDPSVEPWHNWQGSMMSHATRDPLFWGAVAIANQDFPGVGDMCIRCHTPPGWTGGRSIPTNGSALQNGVDDEGVTCASCHKLTNPDQSEHLGLQSAPFLAYQPGPVNEGNYGLAQYVLWPGYEMMGPYDNVYSYHLTQESDFHRSPELCGTCHDVSNPVTGDLAPGHGSLTPLAPGKFSGVLGSPVAGKAAFNNPPYAYGTVERTYSEHKASAFPTLRVSNYGTLPAELRAGSIEQAYDAAMISTPTGDYEDGDPRFFTCQTCHMPPVVGTGDGIGLGPVRRDVPKHTLVGGNYWTPRAIQYLEGQNRLLLGNGLTVEQHAAIDDGVAASKAYLEAAASLKVTGNTLRVVNLTGHKLFTGYPEGRRMWVRTRWYDNQGALLREDGEYGPLTTIVNGQPVSVDTLLDPESPHLELYEAKPGITQEWAAKLLTLGYAANLPVRYDRTTGAVTMTLGDIANAAPGDGFTTFHFALNDKILEDNRIPPYGLDYDEALKRNATPIPTSLYGNPTSGQKYRYYDEVALSPPLRAVRAEIELMFQPTSWEYIQFLMMHNSGQDPFLKDAGKDVYEAWRATGMAAPHVMASAEWTSPSYAWTDLGNALAGSDGAPKLIGYGSLKPNTSVSIQLSKAKPNAFVAVIAGLSTINAPFVGGVLVPSPTLVIPNLFADATGKLTLGTAFAGGLPSGSALSVQTAILDPAAPQGVALSNAIRGVVP